MELARAKRPSPVVATEPSPNARSKKAIKRNTNSDPVHSFAGLMDHLGTMTRNTMRMPLAKKRRFTLLSQSTPLQEAAFRLLGFDPKRDGVDAPRRHLMCQNEVVEIKRGRASVEQVTTIGLDIAKRVFQAHGADKTGREVFRKKLTRGKVLSFLASQPRCLVALEACGGAHHWGREISKLGYEVRLIAPKYVKPFVKRQKNDLADAEAICEAAQRPTMRFVAVKSEAAQASALVFRTRDMLVGQRTQTINALRGHLMEYGFVVAQGTSHVAEVIRYVQDPQSNLPKEARSILEVLIAFLKDLDDRIKLLDREIARRAREDQIARRLMSIPGIGAITATAIAALAPPEGTFRRGRDFAAWVGLTPLQHSTGGKQKLGATSKMGERTIRRLLIIGASAVVRQAARRGAPAGSWLARMLARKPRVLVSVALANKMARIAWALLSKGEYYTAPVAA